MTILKLTFSWFLILFSAQVYAGTCTSISRTNNSANSVLTSTKYNTDHNTAYTAINAFDGGCVTDGTLEDGALNTTDFAVPLNGIQQGCRVTRSDANTLSVDKCMLSVNGAWVKTTSANTVTWGCSGCSSELPSESFYLYAKSGSSSTTLNLLISTTAPNADGYDASSNKVLGKFYNDSNSAISSEGVEQWVVNTFKEPISKIILISGSGHGSSNTTIRRFAAAYTTVGEDITWNSSSTAGDSFTINATGRYSISYTDNSDGTNPLGISRNATASELSTSITGISSTRILNYTFNISNSNPGSVSWAGSLASGDVIRAHTNGFTVGNEARAIFAISRIE